MLQTLNINQLKDYFINFNARDLDTLTNEDLTYALETLTPYANRIFYTSPMKLKFIKQWLEHEETWEEFPVSRKTMFECYRDLTGDLPEITITTLELFNYFIGSGLLNKLGIC